MSGEVLQVNPPTLDSAGTAFDHAASGLASLHADSSLGEAAGAVAALQTAGACRNAQAGIGAMTASVAAAARAYGADLKAAASRYETGDRAARDAIAGVPLPGS